MMSSPLNPESDESAAAESPAAESPAAKRPAGSPFDNQSIVARLAALPAVASVEGPDFHTPSGVFSGFRALAAAPDPALGTAVLVHGWPEFASSWEEVATRLLAAGMNVLAYDQRGYSSGLRPIPVEEYAISKLANDLDAITSALGIERFHLVGHDWGGVMGWSFAEDFPNRLRTLVSVASAHTAAHGRRMSEDSEQYERMAYMRAIRADPDGVAQAMLRNEGELLLKVYEGVVPQPLAASYVERLSEPDVFAATLKYYRALGSEPFPGSVTVPTCYIWGSNDVAFTRGAAELTAEYVDAPYEFVPIEGATHWLCEEHPEIIAEKTMAWARAHP